MSRSGSRIVQADLADVDVEVSYAEAGRAIVKSYRMCAPCTVADALVLAAADPDFAGIDVLRSPVGVFGTSARPEQRLNPGDRVEIYRPLAADPKAARRARAKQALKGKSGATGRS